MCCSALAFTDAASTSAVQDSLTQPLLAADAAAADAAEAGGSQHQQQPLLPEKDEPRPKDEASK